MNGNSGGSGSEENHDPLCRHGVGVVVRHCFHREVIQKSWQQYDIPCSKTVSKDTSSRVGKMAQYEALSGKARGLGSRSPEATQMPRGLSRLPVTPVLEDGGRIFRASWLARLGLWALGLRDFASKE